MTDTTTPDAPTPAAGHSDPTSGDSTSGDSTSSDPTSNDAATTGLTSTDAVGADPAGLDPVTVDLSDESAPVTTGSGDAHAEHDDVPAVPVPAARPSLTERLEREGEVAADYLERLLDLTDLDGDLDVDIDGDRAAVAIVDSEEGRVPRRLVGRDGEVLEALQELTRLAVLASTGERSRLMLDVAGHRAARREALVAQAGTAVQEVTASGNPLTLPPMSPFERKVVHDAVADAGLRSESEGVEPNRCVVVLPA